MTDYTPHAGDIGLTQIRGGVGKLIRFGQWLNGDGFANYEHAFVYVGNGQIVEAEPGGARLANLSEYDGNTVAWLKAPENRGGLIHLAAVCEIGTPYSFLDYLALAAVRFHLPSKWLRARVQNSGHLICSQLADLAASRAGWHLFDDGRLPQDVTPGDLYGLVGK